MTKITSLAEVRKLRQNISKKKAQPPEDRIAELEQDMLRVIDYVVDLDNRLESCERFQRKLLHLIQDNLIPN